MTATPPTQPSIHEAHFVREAGYDRCIKLSNETTRVVLEPNLGGRVLSYQLDGTEILFQNPSQNGAVWDGKTKIWHPSAGRFDIGPEYGGFQRDELWLGRWNAEITGPRSARLTSATLAEGLQLVREFTLAENSSHLRCTQIFRNRGVKPLRTFHWGRTFVVGSGIALAPIPKAGRFPRGYALGGPANVIDFQPPDEPNVRIRENILEIVGAPSKAKFILDVDPGWIAYASPNNLLFVKKFAVFSDRPYGEVAANNASIWYSSKENFPSFPHDNFPVEIEPIGPLEIIEPGEQKAFTEDWWLAHFAFPENRRANLEELRAVIEASKARDDS